MKYVIMCGTADYIHYWPDLPKHLQKIHGEVIVERTIRILHELGIDDITITSNDDRFANLGVNYFKYDSSGTWCNGFFNFKEPVCYIFGDVYFSYSVLYKMINTDTDDIEFFASNKRFIKRWAEPYGFKVVNYNRFFECIEKNKELFEKRVFPRSSAWELWQIIKDTEYNHIDYNNYVAINDYSCDIDEPKDIGRMEWFLSNQNIMIHCVPSRFDYVMNYLIPSLEEQRISKITIYNDINMSGNLQACVNSFKSLPDDGYTWHLQDDIVISRSFVDTIKDTKQEIVCGFSSSYDRYKDGLVTPNEMWFSFPCIKIPNKIAKEFANWIEDDSIEKSPRLANYIKENKYDDTLFKKFLIQYYPDIEVLNLNPNIVNHIDYLLGGSVATPKRNEYVKKILSRYWSEDDIIKDIEEKLKNNN